MIPPLALFAFGTFCLPSGPVPPPQAVADTVNRAALYRQGIAFDAFMDQVVRRREMWLANHARGRVPDALLREARAVSGRWYLLVVAIDRCSDSANIVPYLAHLVDAVDGLDMRIVDPDAGREVMEAHRTPDGRAATPTVVLLNERFEEVGCFIERPAELRDWALERRDELDDEEFLRQKFAWYDREQGRQTMREVVDLMREAGHGRMGC